MGEREIALITGASMGIGKELAKIFAADGRDLVLVARSEDKLRSLGQELESAHGITAHVVPADLTDPAAPANVFASLESKGLQLDYLVNNAGFGTQGPVRRAVSPVSTRHAEGQYRTRSWLSPTWRCKGCLHAGRGGF